MEHIFYKELNLLLIKHEEKKFSLFNVVSGFNTKDGYKTKPVSFLPAFLPTLEVMENAKLILTENKVYTLDGHIVAENFKHDAKISVSKFAQNWKILVRNKHGEVQKLGIWDGKEIIGRYQGDNIFFDENNIVVAQKLPSSFSYKFTIYHNGVLQKYSPIGDDVYLFGDTLVCCNDKETVYSIATGEIICENVEGVFCSENGNFLLCFDENNCFSSYYNKRWTEIGEYEYDNLYDDAKIFSLRKNGKYYIFEFNGKLLFGDVDDFSLSHANSSLLLKTDGEFMLLPC